MVGGIDRELLELLPSIRAHGFDGVERGRTRPVL
jgi:hypothetical protein